MLTILAIALSPPKLEAVTFASAPKVAYVLARDVAKARKWKLTFDRLTKLATLDGKPIPVDQPTLFGGEILLEAAEYWPSATVGPKRVEVDLNRQVLRAWQGNILVMRVNVNSGKLRSDTPPGKYVAGAKKADKVSSIYGSRMPYSVHLRGNYFVHGSDYTLNDPGSHGCVRLPMYNHAAEWFYKWVETGTPVKVFGKRPKDSQK
jgi:hypothetical protein